MTLPVLPNPVARRLHLAASGLGTPPTGPARGAALSALVESLGFVQIDSIQTVARAHHMILFARRQSYRQQALAPLIERDRSLWEHWTHDAAALPTTFYPHWRHRFARDAERLHGNWRKWFREGYEAQFDTLLRRIEADGPVKVAEVGEGEARGKGGWWDWHPSKTALEWLWRTGALAITRRDGFHKVYDLAERVIPAAHFTAPTPHPEDSIDWACNAALDRLGFATPAELAAFWRAVTPDEARIWCRAALACGDLAEVAVVATDGSRRAALIRPATLAAPDLPEPPARLRILSPFDPALRDRVRAERLFGFHYRIEVFVPAPQRRFGYYVFPVLQGARLIGRIDAKAQRESSTLAVRAFWPEPGVRLGAGRLAALDAELARLAAFAECTRVEYLPGWLRDAAQRA